MLLTMQTGNRNVGTRASVTSAKFTEGFGNGLKESSGSVQLGDDTVLLDLIRLPFYFNCAQLFGERPFSRYAIQQLVAFNYTPRLI